MLAVSKVAKILCGKAKESGLKVNTLKVIHACLLHDVLRVCDMKNFHPTTQSHKKLTRWKQLREKYGKIGHARAMQQVLNSLKEPELANLVRRHDFDQVNDLQTLEEKIVFYADKRVKHDQIVTLKERFRDGRIRNLQDKLNNASPDELKEIDEIEKAIYKLEKELKNLINYTLT